MPSFSHGSYKSLSDVNAARKNFYEMAAKDDTDLGPPPTLTSYGYLFPELQSHPGNFLPEAPSTVANLILLGSSMRDDGSNSPALNSNIPSAYTYFAQFIDHDITLEAATQGVRLLDLDLGVLPPEEILALKNTRTANFDLDSVYGPAYDQGASDAIPRNGNRMVVEGAGTGEIPGTDLPREILKPHTAKIGDQRNDTHLIISQMHLAFLRAHNSILARIPSFDFEKARKLLRQHYQWIVVDDFLKRIVDPTILQQILDGAVNIFDPPDDAFYLPLEFSVAAYRFGHSMVRNTYDYNATFNSARLRELLLMPGQLKNYPHILDDWIIDWRRFVEGGTNVARTIDTSLVEPLASLPGPNDRPLTFSLAVRDLLRGYVLRIPTGQAVAQALGLEAMTAIQIENAAMNEDQKRILQDPKTNLSVQTPLWFYILAEASHYKNGRCLGPVGSSLVATVLIGLIRRSKDSYFRIKNWSPEPRLCTTPNKFDLPALFQLAGVL